MARRSRERSKFDYQPRNREDWKKRASQRTGMFDPIFHEQFTAFLPKEGDNCVRFMPPTWKDPRHYGLDIFVHSRRVELIKAIKASGRELVCGNLKYYVDNDELFTESFTAIILDPMQRELKEKNDG